VEPGGLFTLILIGFCLIAFGYRCAAIILRKPWPATSDDPYIVDVLRGRDRANHAGGRHEQRRPRRYADETDAIARHGEGI
jgi:hypothetical protein